MIYNNAHIGGKILTMAEKISSWSSLIDWKISPPWTLKFDLNHYKPVKIYILLIYRTQLTNQFMLMISNLLMMGFLHGCTSETIWSWGMMGCMHSSETGRPLHGYQSIVLVIIICTIIIIIIGCVAVDGTRSKRYLRLCVPVVPPKSIYLASGQPPTTGSPSSSFTFF